MEKYELIKKIGEGTFSTVFLARKRENGRTCAIKILKKKYKTMMEVDELR
jgi:serine/threonine protein kinase